MNNKILVIDDDEGVTEYATRELSRAGYRIETASNGEEGFTLFQQFKPTLVICDLKLPARQGDGFQVIEKIQGISSNVKLIAISGAGKGNSLLNYARSYDCEVIKKPIFGSDLINKVREVMGELTPV